MNQLSLGLEEARRINKRYDDDSQNHTYQDVKEYFRKQYYEALDVVINDIRRHFHQENFTLVSKIEKTLIDAAMAGMFLFQKVPKKCMLQT